MNFTFFHFLTMLGGLALFLYGMNLLGDGLSKASGGRMEGILERLTNSPIKAVLMGAGVTAAIQSSSATTVMVVGFVNSGIMKLQQAVGIIMGANVGTTVTSWILSLTGIDSSNFFIQLLKPTSFSPVLAVIGVIIMIFSKKERKRNIAIILVGFAVLMFGMDTMSTQVKPLANVPEFTGILTRFSNPILGMLAGAVLTAIIQSSSASVGILQALCMTGAINYNMAIPIIMGQNIGTCVTALLSGMGASKNAKRAALIHLYFNVLGTVVFMLAFYILHMVLSFTFMDSAVTPFDIALLHTIFNISSSFVLLPFSKGLVKLAHLTIREEDKQVEDGEVDRILGLLEMRFLETPSFAIEQSRRVSEAMAKYAMESMDMSMEMLKAYDEEKAERIKYLEDTVDRFEDALGTYLVKLSSRNLSEKDSHTLSMLLHCIGDFERISDHALNLTEAAEEIHEKNLAFSEKAVQELEVLIRAVQDILSTTFKSFTRGNIGMAIYVEPLEEVIDDLNVKIKQRHVKRLQKGKCTIEMGFILTDITTNLERVSDHCSNIALCILGVSEDELDSHAYLDKLKQEDNMDFQGKVMAYRDRYRLPKG